MKRLLLILVPIFFICFLFFPLFRSNTFFVLCIVEGFLGNGNAMIPCHAYLNSVKNP